jgi:hypothetical protein
VLTTAAATRPDPWNGSKAEVMAATEAWSPMSASARYLVRNTPPCNRGGAKTGIECVQEAYMVRANMLWMLQTKQLQEAAEEG